jgi:hypothetical protein
MEWMSLAVTNPIGVMEFQCVDGLVGADLAQRLEHAQHDAQFGFPMFEGLFPWGFRSYLSTGAKT